MVFVVMVAVLALSRPMVDKESVVKNDEVKVYYVKSLENYQRGLRELHGQRGEVLRDGAQGDEPRSYCVALLD